MPQATQTMSLSLAGTATVYNLAQRGVGVPTIWNRSIAADGSLVALETMSHVTKRATSNQSTALEARLPTVADVSGVQTVLRTLSGKVSFSIPLAATTQEKTRLCDALIKLIETCKPAIIAGESYF